VFGTGSGPAKVHRQTPPSSSQWPDFFKLLVATAGGIRVDVVNDALKSGDDFLVVGRALML
jgi:3-keto-L-gulonate-6-phosphate decarboxylase